MRYLSKFTDTEVSENHKILKERLEMYKDKGLDFAANREYLLEKAGLVKSNVLDVGTGRGLTSIYLADAGHSVTTVDVDEEIIKVAALNLAYRGLLTGVKMHKMDGYNMDFEDESFGAVFMVEALHHIGDLDKMLTEIDRVLISNGKAVLSDFNKKGMSIVDEVHEREGNAHTDLSTGPEEPLERLEKLGYEVALNNDICQWVIVARKGDKKPVKRKPKFLQDLHFCVPVMGGPNSCFVFLTLNSLLRKS